MGGREPFVLMHLETIWELLQQSLQEDWEAELGHWGGRRKGRWVLSSHLFMPRASPCACDALSDLASDYSGQAQRVG